MKKSHIANMRLLQKFVIFGYFEPIFYIRSFVADIGIRLKKPKMTKNCENMAFLEFFHVFMSFLVFCCHIHIRINILVIKKFSPPNRDMAPLIRRYISSTAPPLWGGAVDVD